MAASQTPPNGGDKGAGHSDLTPQEREAFKQRADELGKRLDAAKSHSTSLPKANPSPSSNAANGNAMGKALRISTELVGGVIVGAGLGWLIDKALGTFPAFFIVLFLLGAAAGMVNIVRAGTAMKTGASNPKAGPAVRDDEED
ncbi:MAG: AtpZ/AtpI family protein [Hyphomicrobiaceae bacterium]